VSVGELFLLGDLAMRFLILVAFLSSPAFGCMAPDSQILKADGSYALIGNVHTGDKVMGYDPKTKGQRTVEVAAQVMDAPEILYELSLDLNGDNTPDEVFYISGAHYFLMKAGMWKSASTIKVGEELMGDAGVVFTVLSTAPKRFTEKTDELPWKRTGDWGRHYSFNISVVDAPAFFVTRLGKKPVIVATSTDLFRYYGERKKVSTK
jgi:hypothetical protein